jgi:hypothetical protein
LIAVVMGECDLDRAAVEQLAWPWDDAVTLALP